jgi:iron complex transport system substrate-binding protein
MRRLVSMVIRSFTLIVRLKFQKQSVLKFVSRTIPHSGGYNTPQLAAKLFPKLALVFIPVILLLGFIFPPQISFAGVFTDETGRKVNVMAQPLRIVSLAPGITEILYEIGLADKIVGVTSFCDWPQAAKKKLQIGGFTNPSIEKIISLQPDLIIATADGNRRDTVQQLERVGLSVYVTNPSDTDGIIQSILNIGVITGRQQAARRLTGEMQKRLDNVSLQIKGKRKPRVFFQIGIDPVMTVGRGTLIHDVIGRAGGINIAGLDTARYPRYSAEGVMAGSPDILLFAPMAHDREDTAVKKIRQQFPGVTAVKNNRIYSIDTDLIGRASPRIIDAIEQMAKILHPEIKVGSR